MLKTLEYSVTFPTTGRTLAQSVNFQNGFGAIIGANEAGKSFIIEMIRWMLFGTKALRGKAEDYKTLRGKMSLAIRGVDYSLERSPTNAKLFRGSEEIAVGTRPVNDKVVQLLGYGLTVFDTAHVANQGDLEKLGAMLPGERKRMVDSVIGLGVIEDMAKSAGEEANALKRRAEDLKASVVEPETVVEPEGYRPSAEIKAELDNLTALRSEFDQLNGWLKSTRPEPVEPTTDIEQSVTELTSLADNQRGLHTRRLATLQTLESLPEPSPYSDEELVEIEAQVVAYEAYAAQQSFLNLNPVPPLHDFEIHELRQEHVVWDNLKTRERLQKQIDDLLTQGHHCCPECSHEWPVANEAIDQLRDKLGALPQVPDDVKQPTMTIAGIEMIERQAANWLKVADQWAKHKDAVETEKPVMTMAEVAKHKQANQQANRREALEAQLAELMAQLKNAPDYAKLLVQRQGFERDMERYLQDVAAYKNWQVEFAKRTERVNVIEPMVERLSALQLDYESARSYENAKTAAAKAKERYDTVMATVAGFLEEATDWGKARDALTALRGMVKQHLVPSLNRVASHLIKQMTGGQRQKVVVDEEFNVLVDDQPLNTLSGSGKAVANLALRLGLGQVLTNNVFSLFVGDEIDASMDKDRAENTADTLQTLKQRISQILLVTHKLPVADYYISLGNNYGSEHPEQ